MPVKKNPRNKEVRSHQKCNLLFVNSSSCLNGYGLHACSSQHTEQGNEVIGYHEEVSVYVEQKGLAMYFSTESSIHMESKRKQLDAKSSFEH